MARFPNSAYMLGLALTLSVLRNVAAEQVRPWTWGLPITDAQSAFGTAGGEEGVFVVGGTRWLESAAGQLEKRWLKSAFHLDHTPNKWRPLPDFPQRIGYPLVTLAGNQLYAIGGRNESEILLTTYYLSLEQPAAGWKRGPDLPRPLCRLRGGIDKGTIYAISDEYAAEAETPSRKKQEIHACDLRSKDPKWRKFADGPDIGLGYCSAAVCDGSLYVFGGAKANANESLALLDSNWKLDLATGQWSRRCPLPFPLRDANAIPLNDEVIAIVGGVVDAVSKHARSPESTRVILSSQCLLYEIQENRFNLAPPFWQAVADHGLAVFDSHLWIVGGEDSTHRTRTDLVQQIPVRSLLTTADRRSKETTSLPYLSSQQ